MKVSCGPGKIQISEARISLTAQGHLCFQTTQTVRLNDSYLGCSILSLGFLVITNVCLAERDPLENISNLMFVFRSGRKRWNNTKPYLKNLLTSGESWVRVCFFFSSKCHGARGRWDSSLCLSAWCLQGHAVCSGVSVQTLTIDISFESWQLDVKFTEFLALI